MSELLRFSNVSYTYPGGAEALHNVTFSISEGERVALLGLNGSGKSTLQLHTNGLLLPTSGLVEVDGEVLTEKTLAKSRQVVGMVFQNSDDQLFMPTVEADVAFGPQNMGLSKAEITHRVDSALEAVGMAEFRSRSPFQLSGGQKRMVAIATVLSMTPRLLVLDEPTSSLDYAATARFISLVESLTNPSPAAVANPSESSAVAKPFTSGLCPAILMSTHDIDLARRLCSRALVMDRGSLIYDGPIASLNFPPL